MSKYYYHGTDINSFIKILDTGEIKCRKLIEKENIVIRRSLDVTLGIGYNGWEYISLCKLDDYSYEKGSAYDVFVRGSFCFIISDEVHAIKPLDINSKEGKKEFSQEPLDFIFNRDDSELRFSDMKDEWQVKKRIPLTNIVGIGIPVRKLEYYSEIFYDIQRALALAEIYHLDVVDSSKYKFIEEYESIEYTEEVKEKVKTIVYRR